MEYYMYIYMYMYVYSVRQIVQTWVGVLMVHVHILTVLPSTCSAKGFSIINEYIPGFRLHMACPCHPYIQSLPTL